MRRLLAIVFGLAFVAAACSLLANPDDLTGGSIDSGSTPGPDATRPETHSPEVDAGTPTDASDASTLVVPQTIAIDDPGPTSITATVLGDVYWINATTHLLHAVDKDGGAPLTFVPSDAGAGYLPRDVVANQAIATVFVPGTPTDFAKPAVTYYRNAGSPTLLVGGTDNGGKYTAAAIDSANVYVLVDACSGTTSCVFRRANGSEGHAYENLVWRYDAGSVAGASAPGPLSYDEASSSVLFFTQIANTWTLRSVLGSASSGTDSVIATESSAPRAMAINNSHVYWIAADGSLKRVAKSGGTAESFGSTTFSSPFGLVLGTKDVFVTDRTDGSVHAVRIQDGSHRILAQGELGPSGITLSPTHVIWANTTNGQIRALPIP